ncbi:peptidase M24 family protein [Sphingomonas changbaiensis NBRC 104936]|uniref:Peptidase M24 family protein n=1 Tax=Sphingomonas changbaiensis NBRC 104936 TaxID=1219043 RepID=A0A0E9MMW2_9SPHN|nr:Xaa-Pro peptidase family protein [Sphingomonas changbaiensis]GAO38455.1 peptidase M24 family protein [Sphingomonas changbaiensis NBRC 104936]
MNFTRRTLLGSAVALGALAAMPAFADIDTSGLTKMTGDIVPIGREERMRRLARAQELMRKNGLSAVVIEPGSSLIYFTGVRWHRSERLTAGVIPVSGEPLIVTPFFERPSVQETLGVPAEIRVWQEDESPTAVIANWLKERRLDRGQVGIEETVRFFASDGLGKLLPAVRLVSANPVVRGCRMHKTPAEIALMQKANDVTIAALRWTVPRIREGMPRDEIAAMIVAATQALGGQADGALVLLGEAAAYPHGSGKPQIVREGEVVLMDCGCTVDGYASDISRTFVPGKVPADVRRVFETVAEGQRVAMRTARLGTPCGQVDDAVRAFYEREGYGPGYKLPGLSHRTGHGIGMDGHEPVNLVHGETTPLEVGMCFSNEPGLYLPGKFGVRLEDCFHMTPAGPKFFSEPPASIDTPV